MSIVTTEVPDRLRTTTRILLAVHGGEPEGWVRTIRRLVGMWDSPSVRVLGIVAVPSPPFTSLIPPAARRYRAARAAWAEAARARVRRVIEAVRPALPAGDIEVLWVPVSYADSGLTLGEHARTWAADVLVLAGPPAAGPWPGISHDRVIRRARCFVLVTPVED